MDHYKELETQYVPFPAEMEYIPISAEIELDDVEPAGECSEGFYQPLLNFQPLALPNFFDPDLAYGIAETHFPTLDWCQPFHSHVHDPAHWTFAPAQVALTPAAQFSSSFFDAVELEYANLVSWRRHRRQAAMLLALLGIVASVMGMLWRLSRIGMRQAIATCQRAFFTHHGAHPPDVRPAFVAWPFPEGASRPAIFA